MSISQTFSFIWSPTFISAKIFIIKKCYLFWVCCCNMVWRWNSLCVHFWFIYFFLQWRILDLILFQLFKYNIYTYWLNHTIFHLIKLFHFFRFMIYYWTIINFSRKLCVKFTWYFLKIKALFLINFFSFLKKILFHICCFCLTNT